MKFTKAAILSALSATANVNAQSSKAGKNGAGLSLSYYEFPTSANFAGTYELCFQTSILTTRFGVNSTFNICRDDDFTPPTRSLLNAPRPPQNLGGFFSESIYNTTIISTDGNNAYQAEIDLDLTIKYHNWNFQGFANGNKLEMQSFGVEDDGGNVNYTPNDMTCTIYNSDVLSCTQVFQEYCGIDDPNEACNNGTVGEWLKTHSIYSVSAKDISECPEPPPDFCPNSNAVCTGIPLERLLELNERNTGESPKEKSHRRLVTDHDVGVVTHVQSKDSDRLEWIKEHIASQMERMEAGSTSGWDPLIEEYFKNVHSKDIEIDCNFSEDEGSFKCNSSSKSKCGQDLIKGHADLHGEFAAAIKKKEGNPVFVPRDVPDSCV